ncbi:polysaccharide deacetylase family protein [Paenibacillus glufosinatiresistens]|uniref:polysaccharide deacetylase family protein n=1 Tax=Paenibacillus glufosinatiresistens TaxID=3070657 RepID=UPI0038CD4AEA
MKKVGKPTVAFLLAALLLASCSSEGGSTPVQTPGASSGPAQTAAASPSAALPTASTSSAVPSVLPSTSSVPAASGLPSPSPSQEPAGAESPIPIQYQMNSNYDIKPVDGNANKKVVLLTFDDGPKEAAMINAIFDTLDKHQAKAIFFVNGYRVKEHPELLKLIQERGGIIGNHSWDHIVLKKKPYAEVKKQIEDVQKIVKDVTGETPVFFRPPHGAGGDVGKKVAAENGLLYMTWSNGSLDWTMNEKEAGKPDKIVKNVTNQLHAGSNILMHELPWTVEALDKLLTTLEGKGYSFVDPRSIKTPAAAN